MIRLFKLELKRLLSTRLFFPLWLFALLLSAFFAWLPTTYAYSQYTDQNGNQEVLKGLASLNYEKGQQADVAGFVLENKVKQALKDYQACLRNYGIDQSYDLPEGIYEQEIMPIAPLLHGIKELFADSKTGMAPTLMEIDVESMDFYYDLCVKRVKTILEMEKPTHKEALQQALSLYQMVKKPFEFYPGMNSSVLDYQNLLGFLLLLFCLVIIAPTFCLNYQTGADRIFRATKYGRRQLALAKIGSSFLVSTVFFISCMIVYGGLVNSLFGWQSTQTSIQMIYSLATLANLNILELQIVFCCGALLALWAFIALTLCLSALCKNTLFCLALSFLLALAPTVISMTFSQELSLWLCTVLPSSSISIQASLLYAITDFQFLEVGGVALWSPLGMMIACLLEIPLFSCLALYFYCHHH